ncbi:MAG: ABC transporter ATP-binding protein [Treponemataceae bacterium]|nr:ABC transporter ATP-binding protein [Treponemataceae bacterium]
MDFLTFDNVSFTYPLQGDEIETDEQGKPILPSPVFDYFSASLPGGFTSLIGPNASGKSTFMLLAGGRVRPQQGKVLLFGQDIAAADEESRGKLASFIYQNMEFEQDDPVKSLLEQVQAAGSLVGGGSGAVSGVAGGGAACSDGAAASLAAGGAESGLTGEVSASRAVVRGQAFFDEVVSVFELEPVLDRKLSGISKGEMQRVLMAFALLYGSKSIFMDEPMFAMEDRQKHKVMEFLREYSSKNGIPIYIAMHELELSRKYAENVLLFYPNRDMDFGSPEEVLTKEALEKAYGVPAALLRETEALNRKSLNEAVAAAKAADEAASAVIAENKAQSEK